MRSLKRTLELALLVLVAQRITPAVPGDPERVLLDAPRGAWIASVRADAALTVIEERDGWRKVRIEGWTTTDPAETAPAAPATPPGRVSVTGILAPRPGREPETVGAGLLVLRVDDLDRLGAEHRVLGEECLGGAKALDARIADREAALRKALHSSDNFTTAAHRHDGAKAELARARKERADHVRRCLDRADDLFARRAVARAISDATGRYEFTGVAPGRYWIVAGEHRGETVRAWWLEVPVSGRNDIVLDARAVESVGDLYWGLVAGGAP
jgi:hypothetical protein